MKNIFNLNEEEKNIIRGLHNINEQELPFPDPTSKVSISTQIEETSKDELLENMLVQSQRLTRYIEGSKSGRGNWSVEDLKSIQTSLNENIGELLTFLESKTRKFPDKVNESKQSLNESGDRITQSSMERYMDKKFQDVFNMISKYSSKTTGGGMNVK